MARLRRPRDCNFVTVRDSGVGFAVTIDLLDFEAFHHTLNLWLEGCDEIRLLNALFEPGHTFIDIGANVGLYSLQAAVVGGPACKVYSFEPQPRAARALRSSAESNGMETIRVVEMVVGVSGGEVPFFVPSTGSGVGSLSRDHAFRWNPGEKIVRRSTSLDGFISSNRIDRVDLIKIDVEGYELDVLRGASNSLRRFLPIVWFEICPEALRLSGKSQTECLGALESFGYTDFYDVSTLWSGAPRGVEADVSVLTNVVAISAGRRAEFWSSILRDPVGPAEI